ncbi:MAG: class B sortase [Clostridiales bacterium]|nr:class B sortase [Candidatus Equinaster intestinalis]
MEDFQRDGNDKNKENKKKIILIIFIIFLIICFLLAGYFIFFSGKGENEVDNKPVSSAQSEEENLPDNPIDFASLQAKNPEIFAWIKIPGTVIDYPVAQSFNDNAFYLSHDAYGKEDRKGAIYAEVYNSPNFGDPNTVLYGHNMKDGSMFRALHSFSNKEFFDENRYVYIYIPGHIMTYEIIAAYKYDSRHLLNSFDFRNEEVFKNYLEFVKKPDILSANTRPSNLSEQTKLLTLSTCTSSEKYRFLVQGVRISDERTK